MKFGFDEERNCIIIDTAEEDNACEVALGLVVSARENAPTRHQRWATVICHQRVRMVVSMLERPANRSLLGPPLERVEQI